MNTFGTLFRVTTYGESHGPCIGAVVDGCPSRIALDEATIQRQMDRRRPGQSDLTTRRTEADAVRILSGVENGMTLGNPVALQILNSDTRPQDYSATGDAPRPSHADFTYRAKYGVAASSGGGRASARETAARVAAGAVAETFLTQKTPVRIVAWVSEVAGIVAPDLSGEQVTRERVDSNEVRCPDPASADRMRDAILNAKADGDSVGGVITCVCSRVPAGWGEPVFGKAGAMLGAAMLGIPAVKGFEIGDGFAGTRLRGSEHNDLFVMKDGRLGTATNRGGGIQGGITNGESVVFRVAFKPTASISKAQRTADYEGRMIDLAGKGRHDPCVLPRAVPVVEAMAALVLADLARLAGVS